MNSYSQSWWRHLSLVSVTCLAFCCENALAQTHHDLAGAPTPAINPQIEAGHKAFKQACGFCHGEDASGSRAPDLIRSPLVNRDKDGDLINTVVRNGRTDKGMPGFPSGSLHDDQLAAIVVFLHARADEARNSAHVDDDYPLEKLLTGNAQVGKAYFDGPGKCSSCHSASNDLKGIASRIQPIELQQTFLYPGHAVKTAVVTLSSGQQVRGKVAHLDEFSITIRDQDGWSHSWNRDLVTFTVNDPLAAHRKLLQQYTDENVHDVFAYLETLK